MEILLKLHPAVGVLPAWTLRVGCCPKKAKQADLLSIFGSKELPPEEEALPLSAWLLPVDCVDELARAYFQRIEVSHKAYTWWISNTQRDNELERPPDRW
jgi:hypothetical protein